MNLRLNGLQPETFIAQYWQQKPLVLRQALDVSAVDFSANDLAGLACEPMAESRIVRGPDAHGHWHLEHGPFDERRFDELGERDWTLLVQDVEKHYPPLSAWLQPFSFLPSWRLDDLMLSFAAPGGSVGPHVDQYDVFLIQVEGERHWQIAENFNPKPRHGLALDMLASFEPEQEWTLAPGDALYLPPNVAHHGVALTACLTASVGFRAPSQAELLMALGEDLSHRSTPGHRFQDSLTGAGQTDGLIDQAALSGFLTLLRSSLEDSAEFNRFIAQFMSRYRLAHEPAGAPETDVSELESAVTETNCSLFRNPWTRVNWIQEDGLARLYCAGQSFSCSEALAALICGPQPFSLAQPLPRPNDRQVLLELLQHGHLILADPY